MKKKNNVADVDLFCIEKCSTKNIDFSNDPPVRCVGIVILLG